ncbi:Hypothetical protein LUCI_4385 [Lucifera butyrica]|uniref:Uncharacterized protein n=1 Tax=Lucifera butyrica TaxID=1351585 RepID=A0A498RCU3_9FIRM|nr:Hypothetical protein LUCI_4385 [Lucifera butyrica]
MYTSMSDKNTDHSDLDTLLEEQRLSELEKSLFVEY